MSRKLRLTAALAAAFGLTLATAALPSAHAAPPPKSADSVIATGLLNPRHLSVGPGNLIYVAETGLGGNGTCQGSPEGQPNCFGLSGSITAIDGTKQKRVVTGLASIGGAGPSDVDVRGNNITILLGLGGNAQYRADFNDPGAAALGTVQTGRIGGPLTTAADLVAFEQVNNPHQPDVDSNPTGLVALDSKNWAIADAGGNDLIGVGKRGETTLAVFQDRGYQSVPTDVVKGPDGAFYVSELTGGPFPTGGSTIWRVVPGQQPTVYATGLSRVTSLDWRGNDLYAVQMFDDFFFSPTGSVRKVTKGGTQVSDHKVVADDLPHPYGIAIRGNTAYVTTDVLGPAGKVRAIALR